MPLFMAELTSTLSIHSGLDRILFKTGDGRKLSRSKSVGSCLTLGSFGGCYAQEMALAHASLRFTASLNDDYILH